MAQQIVDVLKIAKEELKTEYRNILNRIADNQRLIDFAESQKVEINKEYEKLLKRTKTLKLENRQKITVAIPPLLFSNKCKSQTYHD